VSNREVGYRKVPMTRRLVTSSMLVTLTYVFSSNLKSAQILT